MTRNHNIQTSVDPVIFTVFEEKLHILLVKRNIEPYLDCWGIPGGFINTNEDKDLHAAALRKLKEKTNVSTPYLEQVESVGSANRDPRGWSLTVVYFALITRPDILLAATHGASEVCWHPIEGNDPAVPLAFDHEKLIRLALDRLRAKVSYTSVAALLLEEPFTILDLEKIHEIILGRKVEKKSLMRRYLGAGLLQETKETRKEGRMRPAKLYRLKDRKRIHYFTRSMEGPWED